MLAGGWGLPWGLWLREAAASVFLWVWRRVRAWRLQGRKVVCSFTLELGSDINTYGYCPACLWTCATGTLP